MKWIKTEEQLPEVRKKVLFCQSGHYNGAMYFGVFVAHYETQYGIHKNLFIDDLGGFHPVHSIPFWCYPTPPVELKIVAN